MPMTLLDGFMASLSFKTQRYTPGTTTLAATAVEHGCWANSMNMSFQQDVVPLSKLVFCSVPGFKKKAALERDLRGTISGFASKGHASSKPGGTVDGQLVNIVAVVEDDSADILSIACDVFMNSDAIGLIAKGNSSRGLQFESSGTVTTAWVEA